MMILARVKVRVGLKPRVSGATPTLGIGVENIDWGCLWGCVIVTP